MDETSLPGKTRWPDVPDCFGWMRLDARGEWWIRDESGCFGRISHRPLIGFIQRSYAVDESGRAFFQNGPQRVFVDCDYTPYVYRIGDAVDGLVTHIGSEMKLLRQMLIDEDGSVVLDALPGPGVVLDRDLPGLVQVLRDDTGAPVSPEWMLEGVPEPRHLRAFGQAFPLRTARRGELPARLRFEPHPRA